jgi:glutamate transport system ATP-binding protein
MAMVVVAHEMGFARSTANRVVFMDAGRIVEDRIPQEFFTNPESDRAKRTSSARSSSTDGRSGDDG